MAIDNGPLVWFDGKFVPWADANIHVSAHVLHYGSSVFEGVRAYETTTGTAIFRLEPHVRRLVNSCKIARMDMPWTEAQISEAIQELVAQNGQPSCYIRPLAFRGSGFMGVEGRRNPTQLVVFQFSWGKYLGAEAVENGANVGVSSWRRMASSSSAPLGKIGGQYINSQFARMEAGDHGYDEAIMLDAAGYVSEGSGENIFLIFGKTIYTPPLAASILGGVTRESAMMIAHDLGYEVKEQQISRDMLYVADEIFFTGTGVEITPVRSVDHLPIGIGKRGPITKQIQETYFGITDGSLPDKYGWLTHVKVRAAATGD